MTFFPHKGNSDISMLYSMYMFVRIPCNSLCYVFSYHFQFDNTLIQLKEY
nr:NADH-plastoquinone oxidoreductase subunit 4 [Juncus alatus]YP_010290998.1 NADH-plastoquinone oxidoreductase subunit 4 [Juncus alatus]ULQ66585.1 NADH-plastoquinone oxidoreductase subunit 4 [Juncus alatus]ULQ66588.1 NADH-plastoquinone oxidoreductase subunit 4 [Juncus alatus]